MSAHTLVDVVDTESEAAALHFPPLLVRQPVAALLDRHGLGSGPIRATLVGEGHSNVTFLIEREGWRGVLRRPPRPPYQQKAHDMVREATVQRALAASDVPVPRILLLEESEEALGVPFYVMEWLDGDVITDTVPAPLDNATGHRQLGLRFIDTLATLHQQDPGAIGLAHFGRPVGFYQRQLATFSRLWQTHRTRDIAGVEQAEKWLRANPPAPSGEPALVHGDYRFGNLMWARHSTAEVLALLDWELSTLGEPLSDLGYLVSTYPQDPQDDGVLLSLAGAVARGAFPTRSELVSRYAAAAGRDVSDLRWWVVLAFWRTAVGLESFYRRSLAGTTDDPFILKLEHGVPQLAQQALRAIEGDWA
jgi:aminoglycoside phosphotransferase (APT) family kinase protein